MVPTAPRPLHATARDPRRLVDDATRDLLRSDLAASRDAIVTGIDLAAIAHALFAELARGRSRSACG